VTHAGIRPPIDDGPSHASAPDSTCGIVILDGSYRPVWANAEAIRILIYPDVIATGRRSGAIAKKIRSTLLGPGRPRQASLPAIAMHVRSGRRIYSCRAFTLEAFDRQGDGRLFGVMLERISSSTAWLSRTATEVGLTPRERQALTLLGQGLTTRQMAKWMGISPNTVKAFLRVIMMKMHVSSRSNILGKVLATQASDGAGPPASHSTHPPTKTGA
jgi:DNA-binding CsgD family transcriptional regulator